MEKTDFKLKYFDFLNSNQISKLKDFSRILTEWNQKINLVSHGDIEWLFERHLLPSLSIAKICKFSPGTKILDVGTGGGLPGIPLAICFPEVDFILIDSIRKKINVVHLMAQELKLKNVQTLQIRVENLEEQFDFVIGRAVTALPQFILWVKNKIRPGFKSPLSNGILYLKGGDFTQEIEVLGISPTRTYFLSELFDNEFCQEKCLIYFERNSLPVDS